MSLAKIQEPPERGLILLAGPPGAGKSTFCHQVVLNSVAADRPVIFVTTERSATDIISLLQERGLGQPVPGMVSFVDASCDTVGLETLERPDTMCADCTDLNTISIATTRLQERMRQKGILLAFDSLTSPSPSPSHHGRGVEGNDLAISRKLTAPGPMRSGSESKTPGLHPGVLGFATLTSFQARIQPSRIIRVHQTGPC